MSVLLFYICIKNASAKNDKIRYARREVFMLLEEHPNAQRECAAEWQRQIIKEGNSDKYNEFMMKMRLHANPSWSELKKLYLQEREHLKAFIGIMSSISIDSPSQNDRMEAITVLSNWGKVWRKHRRDVPLIF